MSAIERSALAATALDESTQYTQNDANRGAISLQQTSTKTAQERIPSGNPLWAVPLGSLSVTRDRPIFSPSRRPPAPAVVAAPRVVPPSPVVRPVEPARLNLTLVGTVVGKTESIGVFLDQTTHNLVRLRTGEGHSDWILQSVKAREATLEKGHQVETLRLPAPTGDDSRAPGRGNPQ